MRDLHSNIKTAQSLVPAVTKTTRAGAPVDRRGFNALEYVVLVGTNGDALTGSLKFDLKIESSEDGTNWTAVTDQKQVQGPTLAGSGIFGTIDAPGKSGLEYRIGFLGNARYSRISIVVTGTHTNGTPIGVVAILSRADAKPAI